MSYTAPHMPTIFPVACHTDHIGKGSTFVAIQGMKSDGLVYIPMAVEKGATTIVVATHALLTDEIKAAIDIAGAQLMRVDNTRMALAQLSAQAAGFPAQKLKLIAITGTKGKTTSSFLLTHLLETAGYSVALLSTVHNRIKGTIVPSSLTTAQPDYLHQFFKLCVENQVTHVVMEVAAQAVTLHRVYGLTYDALLFTNFSEEHGEFYTTMDEYFAAKKALLEYRAAGAPALINGDDAWCKKLITSYPHCLSMGMHNTDATHDITGAFDTTPAGTVQGTVTCHGTSYAIICPALVGAFNCYNSMAVAGLAHLLGVASSAIEQGFATFAGVPGRLARYPLPNGASCYIDYAHNPSSYQAVLSTLRKLTDHLIVIFGAGGERDKLKRPIMGAIAAQHADILVITSDNPRTENPHDIMEDICAGISHEKQDKIIREIDRERAIKKAYALSRATSIVVLLGKGTDEYQIVGTTKNFFSEAAIIQSL